MTETAPVASHMPADPLVAEGEGGTALADAVLSPDEAAEVSEIYSRIDRELPILEARVDRLLHLYNL
jgi:hypothetical protein